MLWPAYLHPAMMLLVLTLGVGVVREALGNRRARLQGRPFDSRRHRRLARVFALLMLAGAGSGLASMAWIRGKPVLESFHSLLAVSAGVATLGAAALGLRLERTVDPGLRMVHAALGALALLLGLTAGIAGLSILP